MTPVFARNRTILGTGTSRDRWIVDGARAEAHGRALAAFRLRTAVTGLIACAWFA